MTSALPIRKSPFLRNQSADSPMGLPPASPATPPPANPTKPAVIAAPPPPPPAPAAAVSSSYVPLDADLYALARLEFAAALEPGGNIHASDRADAEETGTLCAQLIDSGQVPADFEAPRVNALRSLLAEKASLANLQVRSDIFMPTVNFIERSHRQIDDRAREVTGGGSLPTAADVAQQNDRSLAAVRDLPVSVRYGVMRASVAALIKSGITGAKSTCHDALRVVFRQVDYAHRVYGEQQTEALPFPASALVKVIDQAQDEIDRQIAEQAEAEERERDASIAQARATASAPAAQ